MNDISHCSSHGVREATYVVTLKARPNVDIMAGNNEHWTRSSDSGQSAKDGVGEGLY